METPLRFLPIYILLFGMTSHHDMTEETPLTLVKMFEKLATQKLILKVFSIAPQEQETPIDVSVDIKEGMGIVVKETNKSFAETSTSAGAAVTITKGQKIPKKNKYETPTYIKVILSMLFCMGAPVFVPINCKTLASFVGISKKKQPLFLFFSAIHCICITDLVYAAISGFTIWKGVPEWACKFLGALHISIFLDLSCIVSFICLYRIIAVMQPRRYKTLAHYCKISGILAVVIASSALFSATLVFTKVLNYKYLGPPQSVGCTLFLEENFYYAYISVFIIVVMTINVILVLTYLTLNNKLKMVLNTSSEVRTMKKGARFVTSITAVSYFVCYTPTVIAYIILSVRPDIMTGVEPPYTLIVDFLLRILSHLNSCVLPLCLVTGKTLNRLQVAAKITRRSTQRYRESYEP